MTKRQSASRSRSNTIACRLIARILVAALSIAILNRLAEADVPTITVFKSGRDSYHTFRIPVIVRAKNGDLLAFAEGRKNSTADHGDIDIVLKRSHDNGKTWSPMQVVQDEPG